MIRIWYTYMYRGMDVKKPLPYKVTIQAPSYFNLRRDGRRRGNCFLGGLSFFRKAIP